MNGHIVINARLNAFSGLTALVSDRIYPSVMPDAPTYPSVTYHQVGSASEKGSTSDPSIMMGRFQVTAWDKSMAGARAVADQIRKALDRYRAVTISSVQVDDCIFEGDSDLYDFDARVYYVAVDFRLHYREA